MPKVKQLRVIFKQTGFIKACPPLPTSWDMHASVHDRRGSRASKTNQSKKHLATEGQNADRFVCLDLRKQVVDQQLILEPFTSLDVKQHL